MDVDKLQLETWYLKDHLTLAEIGKLLGITRQAVLSRINRLGIDKSTAERFDIKCDFCGKLYSITRKRFKLSVKHFCSNKCYQNGYMHNPDYRQWRTGQRVGRALMDEFLKEHGILMNYDMVVHHIDGDQSNNELSNLMVFNNASEHLAHHHKLRRKRLEKKP